MPRRRRLLTPMKKKANKYMNDADNDFKETTPRGRLKGALLDALEPVDEYHLPYVPPLVKKERILTQSPKAERQEISDDEERHHRRQSPQRQSYVLKLFDRSVDLSQFEEDSPLYPICRAWIANQPKVDYKSFGKKYPEPDSLEDNVELPGPRGPPISKIPELLPVQVACRKENINLNYREAPPPSREQLLQSHMSRWAAVRQRWVTQAAHFESRYEDAQQLLNSINVNAV